MSIQYPKGLIGFFDQQVLAAYRNDPHKYEITSDNFEGTITVTDEYYRELEAVERTGEYLNIRFGYRTLIDGNLTLVVVRAPSTSLRAGPSQSAIRTGYLVS